jgi:NAD(P)-dependent dehydrogenase (short-subunit alcohol dehydrogenase family)
MEKQKVVLITGGTSGIGLGTVEYLLEQKGYCVLSFSRSKDHIEAAKKKLGAKAEAVCFLQGDVSSRQDCVQLAKIIDERYHRLDGLVNAAGIIKLGGIEKQTYEEWDKSMAVNLTSVFTITKELLPLLKKGTNPSIVNISSMASGRVGGSIAYCAAKAGLDAMTKFLAKELGPYGIRVNSINPGAVYTNIYVASGDYDQKSYDQWSKDKVTLYPLGRIGDAKKDLAPAIEFLLSDKALWTTGDIILVDGGISI